MHSELSQMTELATKAARQRAEAFCADLREQLHGVAARTSGLEAAREARDVEWTQMQQGMGEVSERSLRSAADLNELQKAFDHLNYCHLGLSQRLELSKCKLDDTSGDLHKITATTTHHIEEAKLASANTKKLLQSLEERMLDACANIDTYDTRLRKSEAELQQLRNGVGKLEERLQEEEEKVQKEMAEMAKLDSRSAIRELFKNLQKLDTGFSEIAEWKATVHNEVAKLNDAIADNTRNIVNNASDIRHLDGCTGRLDERAKTIEERVDDHGFKQSDLLQRCNAADLDLKGLFTSLEATEGKLDGQVRELEKVSSRIYWCEKGVERADTNVNNLSSGLEATNAKIVRDSNRLSLAHGYLKGMTKGISEAQKRAADGLDGMLPKQEEISLPGLPGTRRPASSKPISGPEEPMHGNLPRRPATSMA